MDKKRLKIIIIVLLIAVAGFNTPKAYNAIVEKRAQNALEADATALIKALSQEYGVDEYQMEVIFPDYSDIFYYINVNASDSDMSQSQIRSFADKVWSYDYEDPKHSWSRSASGKVEINGSQYHSGGLTSTEWFEKQSSRTQTTYSSASGSSARHTDSEAWTCAKKIVKDSLKAPSTAKFCSFPESKVKHLGNGEYMVTGWVEAQNSFGAMLRQSFVVTYTATEKGYKNGIAIID